MLSRMRVETFFFMEKVYTTYASSFLLDDIHKRMKAEK